MEALHHTTPVVDSVKNASEGNQLETVRLVAVINKTVSSRKLFFSHYKVSTGSALIASGALPISMYLKNPDFALNLLFSGLRVVIEPSFVQVHEHKDSLDVKETDLPAFLKKQAD